MARAVVHKPCRDLIWRIFSPSYGICVTILTIYIHQMQNLISEAKKSKMNSDDRTVLNVVGLIAPFMVSARAVADSLGTIKQNIDKNKSNIRVIAYAQERLEQYTRRDNLRLFNFPACEDAGLRVRFIELAQILGVTVKETDINIIHHLPSRSPNKPVIVRFNNRHIRNQILYAKKAVLNTDECPFKGVYMSRRISLCSAPRCCVILRDLLTWNESKHQRVNFMYR